MPHRLVLYCIGLDEDMCSSAIVEDSGLWRQAWL